MRTMIETALAFVFLLLFTSTAYGSPASYCDASSGDICYSWAVPSSTTSSTSNSLYLRLEAPTDYQWIALGTGSRMSGSTMFVIYQDGSGNVTLSIRKGYGHNMPTYNRMSDVKLIGGSGTSNKTMVANIHWSGATGIDLTGSNHWISAWKKGSPLDTTDASADFNEHDGTDSFSVDLSKASVNGNSNPFTNSSSTQKSDTAVSGTDGGGGEDHTGSIHGVIMAIVFLLGFPIGSVLMPIFGRWIIHASWQIIAFIGMWVGFGVGKVAADRGGDWFHEPHVVLGTIVCILMIIQPVLGWIHHRNYVKHQRRTTVSHAHIWYGRGIMIVGIINGGIGLQLSGASTKLIAAYSVVGVIVSLIYTGGAVYKMVQIMTPEESLNLIKANLAEILNPEIIDYVLLEENRPLEVYWGTATTGKPHCGYFVPMVKIAELLEAGCRIKILIADVHGYFDNLSVPFELIAPRIDRLEFVIGSSFQWSKDYIFDCRRLERITKVSAARKAGAEVVKQENDPFLSGLTYSIMQALDEEYLKVDAELGGIDQRKIFTFALENLHKV
ncbi:hypothetical protein FSPOR_6920 [Fusarium sporotrichioides]|uniref:tyrosine--tRNA ligase n=1 Tax=Fusarium sporotrichioides TaxID=5514 RepID=A0A395S180_FUSSP|nr:hypothetical protein FSPOR_6920 [Fusarium sporotrichioides]